MLKRTIAMALAAVFMSAVLLMGCGGEGGPEETLDKAFEKSMDVKSVHQEYDLKLAMSGDLSAVDPDMAGMLPLEIGITGNADIDSSDDSNPKMQAEINLEGIEELIQESLSSSDLFGSGTDTDALSGLASQMYSKIGIILLDKMLYVQLGDSWYEFDTSEVADSGQDEADTECFEEKAKDDVSLSSMLTDIEELSREDIDGESTRHFKANLDINSAIDQIAEVAKSCDQADAVTSLVTAKAEISGMFKKLEIEFWVDGDDNIRKMSMNIEMDMQALSDTGGYFLEPDQVEALASMSVTAQMEVTQSRFGEDMEIDKPEDTVPIENLLEDLGGLGGFDIPDVDGLGTMTTVDTFSL